MDDLNKEKFLATARDRFRAAEEKSSDWRKQAAESLDFVTGNQWFDVNKRSRQRQTRPCLTINRLSQLVRLVANEINRSKPAMRVLPFDSDADVRTAEIFQGIIRHIEHNSDSSLAYGTATDYQVRCGLGYFGFKTRYARRDSFSQEVELRYFPDPLAVYRDPNSIEFDGSDSRFYFVAERMSREVYEEKYPKSEITSGGLPRAHDGWVSRDSVQVAEYWYVETAEKKLLKLKTGQEVLREDLEFSDEQLKEMVEDERMVEFRTVKRAVINGHEVLEEGEWPGSWIPIIPVFGEVTTVGGKQKISGLIEDAKEPQRMLNYFFSCAAELIALAPKSPWIAAEAQISQHREAWRNSNTNAEAVLTYDAIDVNGLLVGPPQRNTFEPPIQAIVMGLQMAEDGVRHAAGLHGPSLGALSAERSGTAIKALQQQGNISTYHFVLNFSRSVRFAVKQLVGDGSSPGLIQKIYHEAGRIIRILGEDDIEKMVAIGKTDGAVPAQVKERPEFGGMFDPAVGLYDVVADVGQAFSSQRQEAFAAISQIFQSSPEMLKLFGDVWLANADFPGAREMAKRAKQLLPPHIRGEKAEVAPELQEQMQQQQAQLQQMGQALEEKSRIIETKQIEADSKERIEAVKAEVATAKIHADTFTKLEQLQSKENLDAFKQQLDAISRSIEMLRQPDPVPGNPAAPQPPTQPPAAAEANPLG